MMDLGLDPRFCMGIGSGAAWHLQEMRLAIGLRAVWPLSSNGILLPGFESGQRCRASVVTALGVL